MFCFYCKLELFYTVFIFGLLYSRGHSHTDIDLSTTKALGLNQATRISIPGRSYVTLTTKAVSSGGFLVCQAHTQFHNVTLSSQKNNSVSTSVCGRDVGMIALTNKNTSAYNWFLYNNASSAVNALVYINSYSTYDPIPGGCNTEFNLEDDPNIHLHLTAEIATVQYQWSDIALENSSTGPSSCEVPKDTASLEYSVYAYYVPGVDYSEVTFFDSVQKMLTVTDIEKYGTKMKKMTNKQGQKSFLKLASYYKQGVVYAVVVRRGGVAAAYIPIATYACSDKETCKKIDVEAALLATAGGIVGLFLCFFGHRYFKTENFVFGFLMFIIIFYQIFAVSTTMDYQGLLTLTAGFGLLGGTVLLAIWWYIGMPVLNVMLISLVMGYIFSSIIFYTSLGNLSYWNSPFNYGISFTSGVLVLPVILLCCTRLFNMLCCSILGGYGFVLAFDVFLNGGMRYIVLNSLRHTTNKDYLKVVVTGPYTLLEIVLTLVWIVLIILGCVVQYYRDRKKAPFPPCPRTTGQRASELRKLLISTQSDRESLLATDNHSSYGATDGQPSESEKELNRSTT